MLRRASRTGLSGRFGVMVIEAPVERGARSRRFGPHRLPHSPRRLGRPRIALPGDQRLNHVAHRHRVGARDARTDPSINAAPCRFSSRCQYRPRSRVRSSRRWGVPAQLPAPPSACPGNPFRLPSDRICTNPSGGSPGGIGFTGTEILTGMRNATVDDPPRPETRGGPTARLHSPTKRRGRRATRYRVHPYEASPTGTRG